MKTNLKIRFTVIALLLIISSFFIYRYYLHAPVPTNEIHVRSAQIGEIYLEISGDEINAAMSKTTAGAMNICLYPEMDRASGGKQLNYYFQDINPAPVLDPMVNPLLYYTTLTADNMKDLSAMSFILNESTNNMMCYYLVPDPSQRITGDTSACKCPPACCYESVQGQVAANVCNTSDAACPPGVTFR